jgi:hypothetical protein
VSHTQDCGVIGRIVDNQIYVQDMGKCSVDTNFSHNIRPWTENPTGPSTVAYDISPRSDREMMPSKIGILEGF